MIFVFLIEVCALKHHNLTTSDGHQTDSKMNKEYRTFLIFFKCWHTHVCILSIFGIVLTFCTGVLIVYGITTNQSCQLFQMF